MRKFKSPEIKAANPFIDSIKKIVDDQVALIKKLISVKLSDIPGNHKQIGKNFLAQGEYSDAILRFKIVQKWRPDDAEAAALLAKAYALSGELDKAKQALLELRKKHPATTEAAEIEQLIQDLLNPPKLPKAASEPAVEAETETVA